METWYLIQLLVLPEALVSCLEVHTVFLSCSSLFGALCSQGMGLNNMQLSIVKNRYVLVDG
jgi:hypothetical protein